jgi:hypothetical protein
MAFPKVFGRFAFSLGALSLFLYREGIERCAVVVVVVVLNNCAFGRNSQYGEKSPTYNYK